MKPKKAAGESKKTEKKKQEKIIEDKTFGLKNKNKSKTVQKFIKGVATQVKLGNQSQQKLAEDEHAEKKRKKKEEEEAALMASLFKSVETVKKAAEDEEDDDRPQICAYFKQGLCQKGKKCKFSHDLGSHDTKNEEVDLYTEQRLQLFGAKEEEETVENWDATKLQEVVKQKEIKYKNSNTSITCKFFLDAVEKGKYGWKWVCPNGMECIYRHCLPPGFVFKKKGVDTGPEVVDEILEEKLEAERAKLTGAGTPVTLERFLAWKESRKKKKEEEIEEKRKAEEKKSAGRHHGLTGRALFKFDPTLFVDDEEAAGEKEYEIREEEAQEEEGEEEVKREFEGDKEEDEEDFEQPVDENENEEGDAHDEPKPEEVAKKSEEKEEAVVEEDKKKKKKKKKKKAADEGVKVNEDLFKEIEDLEF